MILDRVDDIPFADMVLFAIYSGFRLIEELKMKWLKSSFKF